MNPLECGSIFELQINVMPGSVLDFVAYFFLAVSYAIYVLCFYSGLVSCLFFNPIKHENSKWAGRLYLPVYLRHNLWLCVSITTCYPGIKAAPLQEFSVISSCCPVSGLTMLRMVTVKTLIA